MVLITAAHDTLSLNHKPPKENLKSQHYAQTELTQLPVEEQQEGRVRGAWLPSVSISPAPFCSHRGSQWTPNGILTFPVANTRRAGIIFRWSYMCFCAWEAGFGWTHLLLFWDGLCSEARNCVFGWNTWRVLAADWLFGFYGNRQAIGPHIVIDLPCRPRITNPRTPPASLTRSPVWGRGLWNTAEGAGLWGQVCFLVLSLCFFTRREWQRTRRFFAFENGHHLAHIDEHDQQITHKHMKRKRNRSLVDFTRHQEESLCNCFLRLRSETSGQDLTHSPKWNTNISRTGERYIRTVIWTVMKLWAAHQLNTLQATNKKS